jgi:HAE1 family hydrophobic/amphiphilic exporter-1
MTIMAALPLSLGGGIGLLLGAGEALSLPAVIGILMLMVRAGRLHVGG